MVQNIQLNTDTRSAYPINRTHKDSLFRIAFREKENLLELYNAINGSDYKDPSELTIYTMEDVIFMGIKNDISFLIGEMLNLYEHQSTKNPNMPIRGLMYFAKNYESCIARNDLDIFSSKLQKLPFPQYYVLYNGEKDEEEQRIIELKDAFPKIEGMKPCLNCIATVLNINHGKNSGIMKRSRILRDYSAYIQKIRDNKSSGMDLVQAVDMATEYCIRTGIFKDILLKNSAEVKNMVLGVWGTENHIRKQNEEREQLEQECRELKQKTAHLKKENSSLDHRNNTLKQQNTTLEQQNTTLEQQNIELHQKNDELERKNQAADLLLQKLLNTGQLEELKNSLLNKEERKLLEEYQLSSEHRQN